MKWNNVMLFFLLFIDAHALRRIEELKEEDGEPKKEVLLVVSGLMRDYVKKWPIWQKSLIEPNEKRGVKFTIVVETDLRANCDPKEENFPEMNQTYPDLPFHETDWQLNCNCHNSPHKDGTSLDAINFAEKPPQVDCEEKVFSKIGAAEKQQFVHRMREVFKPQVIDLIIDDEDTNRPEMQIVRTGRIGAKMLKEHKDKLKNGHFDMVMSFRPDMVLVDAKDPLNSRKQHSPVLDLQDVCSTHPGLNIISGDFTRPWVFHDRDWDWAQLLCDGSKFEQVSEVYMDHIGSCGEDQCKDGKPPALPSDFKPSKDWDCSVYACKFVGKVADLNMRFGNLDDVVFGHIRS